MATYSQIQDYVKKKKGYTVKTCWIAHVKELCGLNPHPAPNRRSPDKRENPCPPDKVEAIREALVFFGLISER